MKSIIQRCALLLMLAMSPLLQGATLLDIYRMAVNNNPAWKSFREDLQQGEYKRQMSQGALRPQLGLTGSYTYTRFDSDVAQPPNLSNGQISDLNQCLITNNSYEQCLTEVSNQSCGDDPACLLAQSGSQRGYASGQIGLQASQVIYAPELWTQDQQAKLQQRQAKYLVAKKQQAFLEQLIHTYLLALSTREQLEIATEERNINQQQLSNLEAQFERGLVPASDVLYARATLGLQNSQLQESIHNARNAYSALERFANQKITQLAGLDAQVPMPKPTPGTHEEWIAIALQRSPAILESQTNIKMLELETQKRSAKRKPRIDLVGGFSSSTADGDTGPNNGSTTSGSIGVQMSMPIYTGNSLGAAVKEAQTLRNQAMWQSRSLQNQLNTDITAAFNTSARGLTQIQLIDSAIEALKMQLANLESGFEKGIIDAQEVLTARQNLFKTRQNRQIARLDYIKASIELKKIAGVLGENDIAIIASWSDLSDTQGDQPTQSLFDGPKEWLSY